MYLVARVGIILSHKLVCQQRGLTWDIPVTPRNFYWLGAARLLLLWGNRWGTAPHKVRGVGKSMKHYSRQTLVLGVDARENPGEPLRPDPAFAFVRPPSSWPLPRAGFPRLAPGKVSSAGGSKRDYDCGSAKLSRIFLRHSWITMFICVLFNH